MRHDVAGDPITGVKWTRRTTEKIAEELATLDIQVCSNTVGRLLKQLDYALRVNHKRVSNGSGPDRNEQFEYIAAQRTSFASRNLPSSSRLAYTRLCTALMAEAVKPTYRRLVAPSFDESQPAGVAEGGRP